MLYAKVVLALPIEGPFDYIVPNEFQKTAKAGSRVWINFRNKREVGFIIGTASQSRIPHLKPILAVIDPAPVLDRRLLSLSRKVSQYYCCSWGEAIATALPLPLRKGKVIPAPEDVARSNSQKAHELVLVHDLDGQARWDFYAEQIARCLAQKLSVIVLVADKQTLERAQKIIQEKTGHETIASYRNEPKEWEEWVRIRSLSPCVLVGTRSAVFAPVENLGLIIMDEESDSAYKQDQVPHYHARQVSLMRAEADHTKLVLAGTTISVESFHLLREHGGGCVSLPRKTSAPLIKIIDMKTLPLMDKKRKIILSRFLQDSILSTLNAQGKVLLFYNRKGFATTAACTTCGKILRCPRCNINLVYYFSGNMLRCHYCNFKLAPPKFCPECNSGYIKYSGLGTEKVESELARIFPQARIKRWEERDSSGTNNADIFVATQAILKDPDITFDLTAVLGIDNTLNHVDFRSAEKAFHILSSLTNRTKATMIVQTGLKDHYCIRAIEKTQPNLFYESELRFRKELRFPPYRNFCHIKLRGRQADRVATAAEKLFSQLSSRKLPRGCKVVSVNPGQPAKLRGNYYWTILISTREVQKLSAWLKKGFKGSRTQGIIVTVDMDPA